MWAIDNNISRRLTLSESATPAKIAMIKSLFGGLIFLSAAFVLGKQEFLGNISPISWLTIAAMSVSGFGGALLLFLIAMKRIGTIKTMSVFSMTPIFGIVVAALARGESITVFQVFATGLIIVGILIVSRR